MVALVALLVIGPEKLPKVARMAGFWVAKSRRLVATVKQEINDEFQAEELRQALKNHTGIQDLQKLVEDTSEGLHAMQSSIKQKPEAYELPKNLNQDEQR